MVHDYVVIFKKRRSTNKEWNAFMENDFDAKGNYNFDPLCRQKMSGWTKKGGSREDAKLDGRRTRRKETCHNFCCQVAADGRNE